MAYGPGPLDPLVILPITSNRYTTFLFWDYGFFIVITHPANLSMLSGLEAQHDYLSLPVDAPGWWRAELQWLGDR